MFDVAIELGFTGFAITDHETLSAHVEIMKYRDKLKEEGKLPKDFTVAFGNEAYLIDELGNNQNYYHWLLLAKDRKGHDILRKLSSQAWENSYHDRGMERVPLTKRQVEDIMLAENGKGHLIVTSACIGGELGQCALRIKELEESGGSQIQIEDYKQQMEDYVKWNQEVFGKDDFYIEFAPNDKHEQRYCNRMFINLANHYQAKPIFATDAHYLTKEDQAIHRALLNSKDGEREVDDFYSTAFMMTTEQVWDYLKLDLTKEQFDFMLHNLEDMRSKIQEYTLFQEQIIPKVHRVIPVEMHPRVDDKFENIHILLKSDNEQDLYWIQTCLNELFKRGKWTENSYLDTLENEAEVIVKVSERMGQSMAAYYNTAQRLIEIMWDGGDSLVGASRGSAMAFLSNWLLDITQIDPIPYKIPFWRHLSASRPELPDIDIDAEGFKRDKIIEAMREEFGANRVLNICTYGTEGTKSAIATAARGLGIDTDIAMYLTGMVPNERGFDWKLSDIISGNSAKGRRPIHAFIEEITKHDKLLETALGIEGLVTRRGSHAAGVYIFNGDYTENNAMMKAPSGLYVTQWDMDDSDLLGGVKFDFLSIEALDKIRATMNLLLEDGRLEDQGSLKATYEKYLHPEVLDYSKEMWRPSWEGQVLDLFQFQTPVGGEAIKKGKPNNVMEGAALNSLMRLMPMEDGTVPTDKFVKMKGDLSLWYKELENAGVPKEEVHILERHYLLSFGVPNTQEEMMLILMDTDICGFSELEANQARKIVGKKQMEKIPELRAKIFDRAVCSLETIKYIWETAIGVQMGYSFSLPHTVAYTVIALQELNLFNHYPGIYWNAACLIANSGDIDSGTDYAKIAKAIGSTIVHGVNVGLVDINQSMMSFRPDVEKNTILYGLKALSGVGAEFANVIIANRPYSSMEDFLVKANPTKTQMVSLIKAGSFEALTGERRVMTMAKYIKKITGRKKKLTLANIGMLAKYNLIPDGVEREFRIYEFNRFLKEVAKEGLNYILNDRTLEFYSEMEFPDSFLETGDINDGFPYIACKNWDKVYQKSMDNMRVLLKDNEDLIDRLQLAEMFDEYDRIAHGSTSRWEMDSMSYYHGEHELAHINNDKYGIAKFRELERTGEVHSTFFAWGKEIPIFKTQPIIGTVLGKNKTKGSLDILTPEGDVVLVKMNKELFSGWDRQISRTNSDGTKTILERSWFQRGNLLLINGYRRDDQFIPKAYKHTANQPMYLITGLDEAGELSLKSQRG